MLKWKEAASVILSAASPSISSRLSATPGPGINSKQIEEMRKENENQDFQILALKKSRESPFTPGAYVFPGGKMNRSDSSIEWSNIFSEFGFSVNKLCSLMKNESTGLPIFESTSESLPRCISLRITAIREAFEESGILLCRKSWHNFDNFYKATHLDIKESMTWRRKIMKNANEFLNLCREYKCFPDISSLYLWSDWLTPPNLPIRFDSVFFVAIMEKLVPAQSEDYEIELAKWSHVQDILDESHDKTVDAYLPPPQFYELSRFASIDRMSTLMDIADNVNKSTHDRWMPIRVYASNGEISILPGDEMYPEHPDYEHHNVILKEEYTIEQLRSSRMHRFEHEDVSTKTTNGIPRFNRIVISNFGDDKMKHVQPRTSPIIAKL
ncbi:nucleoside diphosphate-linked moiety X motif 19 isoform X1 [Nilaparvata lugens]|uniref:nucleoside diphosphate-linked moiety X motif 19 isoform X1 n=2 Tax=Nilaparvata lugens TaxID=108931 RepID=UPI00193EC024|nr:nucleoside diphosphate-linked moiety X motif 19 isoform X1 [Nilaparvata lugens]